MSRSSKATACLTLFLLCAGAGPPPAFASDDWNLWHDITLPVFREGRYSMSVYQGFRYRGDMRELFFEQSKIANRYAWHPNLHVAAGYSYIQMKSANNHWVEEHRPEIELSPRLVSGPWLLEDRSRLELRWVEGASGEEDWRWRNRFQVTYAPPGAPADLKLFINEEIFFTTPQDEWNQNRLFAGVGFSPMKDVKTTLAWGLQSVRRGGDWEDRQILNLSLALDY